MQMTKYNNRQHFFVNSILNIFFFIFFFFLLSLFRTIYGRRQCGKKIINWQQLQFETSRIKNTTVYKCCISFVHEENSIIQCTSLNMFYWLVIFFLSDCARYYTASRSKNQPSVSQPNTNFNFNFFFFFAWYFRHVLLTVIYDIQDGNIYIYIYTHEYGNVVVSRLDKFTYKNIIIVLMLDTV